MILRNFTAEHIIIPSKDLLNRYSFTTKLQSQNLAFHLVEAVLEKHEHEIFRKFQ